MNKFLLVLLAILMGGCTEDEIRACSYACKDSGKVMVSYNGTTKTCTCETK